MAILLLAMVGLGRLIGMGTDRAAAVRDQGMASLRCQSKLAEVVAGVEPLQGQSEVPFEDDPAWTWSLAVEPWQELPILYNVEVRVARLNGDGSRTESVLSQLVLDPKQRGSLPPPPADTGMATEGAAPTGGTAP